MDARLKERLVGAAVLVAIAVWVVPWILDGPDTPAANRTVDLELPTEASSAPVRTQTIELGARREPDQRNAPNQATAGGGRSEIDQATPNPAVVSESQATPELRPTPAAAVAAASTAVEHDAGATPADAPGPSGEAEPSWAVQLGSFSDESNARRLAERVSTFGQSAQVSSYRAGGREMYRVRVGSSKTRGEAESKASSLTAHGFVAQVVTAD